MTVISLAKAREERRSNDVLLVCQCGSEALTAYLRNALFYVKCAECGVDLTHVFCGGGE